MQLKLLTNNYYLQILHQAKHAKEGSVVVRLPLVKCMLHGYGKSFLTRLYCFHDHML